MRLYTINTGYFKLDGGAMFGVVPKSIWNHLNPSDSNNMCTWAMRCLLIQINGKLILIDTGIGNKQSPDFLRHFFLHGTDSLSESIKKLGFQMGDVTDVILTHLHFDHVGGAVVKNEDALHTSFPHAKYWVHSKHLNSALSPNPREKASFLTENIQPLVASGQLYFINEHPSIKAYFEDVIDFIYVDGHTEKQVLPVIKYNDYTILYAADLIPSVGHIAIPYVMSYDMQPLKTLKEKTEILERAYKERWLLFFEHDPMHEMCTLKQTPKGIRADQLLNLSDLS